MLWPQVALAYVVDLAFGEPGWVPHPVVLIGRLIAYFDKQVFDEGLKKAQKRLVGMAVVVFVVGISALVAWGIVYLATLLNSSAGFVVSILLISTTIATRGLMDSARDVAASLAKNDLAEARENVGRIVGRDTGNMKRRDVVRATIESVAENSVDGVMAPMMYALIGGAPLAMAYKAVNTLDSMIGYKNERYMDFGWAAARLDDVVNYIPARISVLVLAIAALLVRKDTVKAVKTAIRDGCNHASPNSGLPEAAVAGAYSLKLGGTNYYAGVPRESGFIGDGKGAMTEKNILEVTWLIFVASAITLLLSRAIMFGLSYLSVVW